MFFIGIFGIDQKNKSLCTYNNTICPACGALTRFEIFKTYSYFHMFFVPVFRWSIKYYLKSVCCDNLFELEKFVGQEIEKGNNPEIKSEHLHPINQRHAYKYCRSCQASFESSYSYCPYCGGKL